MSSTVPSTPRRDPWSELIRILILVAASVAIMFPFFTGKIIGGVDARWYAYMLADYIEQVRSGHLLVSVGQASFAWNGSVHLFRSAPVYMAVARVWDLLTFRRLNPFALQHLTVVTSAAAGALGFYAAAVRIIPSRRWIAMAMALLYLATPAWLSTVLNDEAYMSYMAFAALPIVLYGNVRTALGNDGRGYMILGAGLALVWMCHPPIAFITTVATLVLQSGLVMVRGIVSWKNLGAGVVTFAVLGAYYFTSMSEIPPMPHSHPASHYLIQITGFALFSIGIGRFALLPKSFGWLACAALGGAIVGMTDRPWLCWAAATAGVWLLCVLFFRLSARRNINRHAFVAFFLSALAGAAIAEAWVGREGIFMPAVLALSDNTAHIGEIVAPLTTPMRPFQIFQPGWGLLLVFAVTVSSLFGTRPLGAKLFFAVSLGLAICFLRVPLVSNFLIGRFPVDFIAMCGVPLGLRIAPVIASFTALSGVIWISTLNDRSRNALRTVGWVLAALVVWAGYQTVPFLRHSHEMTGSDFSTEKNLRAENAMLDAYVYLLLPIPPYFSHGKTDPLLESRLLDDSGKVLVGPTEDAMIMEERGVKKIRMTTSPLPNSTQWFAVNPPITVEPGEHLLLRFEFDPRQNYRSYFIMQSEHGYREYHLPASGQDFAFGVGGLHTSVLSLWNTGTTPEKYNLSIMSEPGNDIPHSEGLFANLYVSKLESAMLPIALESFMPYRVRVNSLAGGTLESFRVYLPGYRATVDGKAMPVTESRQYLASVAVPGGTHEVEIRFVGTAKLWLAAIVSGIGWSCLVFYCLYSIALGRQSGISRLAVDWKTQ